MAWLSPSTKYILSGDKDAVLADEVDVQLSIFHWRPAILEGKVGGLWVGCARSHVLPFEEMSESLTRPF